MEMEKIFERIRDSAKEKKLKLNENILKKYLTCLGQDVSLISLLGSKRFPFYKFLLEWKDDKCLFDLDAKHFSNKVLLGYFDTKTSQYSISQIGLENLNKFITDEAYRKEYISNKDYVDVKEFKWLSDNKWKNIGMKEYKKYKKNKR